MRPWIPAVALFKATGLILAAMHHLGAGLVLFFLPDPYLFLQFILPNAHAFGPASRSFATDRKEIWLTIDDGPDPASTPRVLELLREHRARATFFVVGENVRNHPALAREIVAQGHTLANHTDTHPSSQFWHAGPARTGREIDGCVAAFLLANVPFERYFRPPVGIRNFFLQPQLEARATLLVLWNARGFDGAGRQPEKALARISRQLRPGAIVVAHEGGPRTPGRLVFLELLLEHLSAEGYSCVLPRRHALRG